MDSHPKRGVPCLEHNTAHLEEEKPRKTTPLSGYRMRGVGAEADIDKPLIWYINAAIWQTIFFKN